MATIKQFQNIVSNLLPPEDENAILGVIDPAEQFDEDRTDNAGVAQALNAAFLISLSGSAHPAYKRAKRLLTFMADSSEWAGVARFYLGGIELVTGEIEGVFKHDSDFSERLEALSDWVSNKENRGNPQETVEKTWSVFFPEGEGIRTNEKERIKTLREKRAVTITDLNRTPIADPSRQILFTSNVLLTIPPASKPFDELPFSGRFKEKLLEVMGEPQIYWYDHPIQIGVDPEKNEILYGLKGLEAAFDFEQGRGNLASEISPVCVLSVSVTHRGLQNIAKMYLKEELLRSGSLKNIDLYLFTEADTKRIVDEILTPASAKYLKRKDEEELLDVFGVDGEYARHYCFLKAIAAFWNIFINKEIEATFKIDLDQVFPQKELVEQTGASVFEHFKTPLWGAQGLDSNGQFVELGMIAGILVNERDTCRSLFTSDVPFPNRPLSRDEYIFFSTLPQALSTEAEMMIRYTRGRLDGEKTCIQRFHVTGGTNGIRVDSLRRYRPFTPSFIGRAEDQAYILSVLSNSGKKLAYVHKDGLIMRHDKESFAREAIESAYTAKLVGDYVRMLYFSAYAGALTDDVAKVKDTLDPFTGCFISKIPISVVCLRFALKAASLFAAGNKEQGLEFIRIGAERIMKAFDFIKGENNMLKERFKKESLGWTLFYDTLAAVEEALKNGDGFADELRKKAENIIHQCAIRP